MVVDVWVLVVLIYLGSLLGVMKNFCDCFWGWIVWFNFVGEVVFDCFKNKYYVMIMDCYVGGIENYLIGVIDVMFKIFDKFLMMGGFIKLWEIVVIKMWGM